MNLENNPLLMNILQSNAANITDTFAPKLFALATKYRWSIAEVNAVAELMGQMHLEASRLALEAAEVMMKELL